MCGDYKKFNYKVRYQAMDLASSTWTDIDDSDANCAVIPVGSTEQHGPHAPLSTDTLTATAVAEAGAAASNEEIIVAPGLPVGASEEHADFAGTLWLSPDTLRAYIRDTVRSLASHGFRRVVVVNGHGGNTDALREVAASLSRHDDVFVAVFTWFDAIDVDFDMGHAGAVETAMITHHHPDMIRADQIADASADAGDQWGSWVSGVNLAYYTSEFAPNGVVGDPSAGDAALGRELTEQAGEALAELLEAISRR